MTTVTSIVSKLRHAGTNGMQDEELIKRTVIVNSLSLTFGAILLVIAVLASYLLNWDRSVVIPLVIEFMINAAVILLNHYRQHLAAALTLFLLQCAAIMYFGILLGKEIQLQMGVIYLIAIIYLIFKERLLRRICFACALLALIFLEVNYYFNTEPIIAMSFEVSYTIHILMIIAVLWILLIVSKPYIKSNDTNSELKKADHYKKIFLYQVTHDLRTPLHVVHVAADLIRKELQKKNQPNKLDELIDQLQAAGSNATTLINNVLSMAEIEAGKMETANTGPLNVKSFFSKIVSVNKVLAKTRYIQLKMIIDPTLPEVIIGDSLKLNQVTTNLLANAIKYADKNSTVTLEVNKLRHKWSIQVTNDGVGIAPEIQAILFAPFVTGIRKSTEGTGLGLYITRSKVETMGGTIAVESTPGKQTTFTVLLPLHAGNAAAKEQAKPPQTTSADTLHNLHVLVADDHALNMLAFSKALEMMGCRVSTASNGEEVLQKVMHEIPDIPDLIILDNRMPILNGEQTLRRLKAHPVFKAIPVIITTGEAFKESQKTLLAAGADGFIEKPVDYDHLEAMLIAYLQLADESVGG